MFDVGFSELIVIAIVALVVIGPERLPKVARTAGLLLGRLQRYVNDVKADINREMQLDELKALRSELQESARDLEQRVSSELRSVEETFQQSVAATLPSPGETTLPVTGADAESALAPTIAPAVAVTQSVESPSSDAQPASPVAKA